MEEKKDDKDFISLIKRIKKFHNFNFSLMSREEKIEYIVNEMEKIEKQFPRMVEGINDNNLNDDFTR